MSQLKVLNIKNIIILLLTVTLIFVLNTTIISYNVDNQGNLFVSKQKIIYYVLGVD